MMLQIPSLDFLCLISFILLLLAYELKWYSVHFIILLNGLNSE